MTAFGRKRTPPTARHGVTAFDPKPTFSTVAVSAHCADNLESEWLTGARVGRQVAAKLTDEQEQALLDYLRESADVALVRVAAPTADALLDQQFAPRGDWNWIYFLWNRAFPWTPQISEHHGHAIVNNAQTAPVIEYTRHNFGGSEPVGRIYWAKDFVAPEGLGYDVASFERWFDSVAGWVRRHGLTT